MIRSICVYCGSSPGKNPKYVDFALEFGGALAKNGYSVIYGGASIGVMGAVADGALKEDGVVIGVLPKLLTKKEVAHPNLTQLIIVENMHQRKQKMFDLADAFVALPGGLGTLEELCEILTWQQLGVHMKPTCVLNLDGYYDPLIKMLDHAHNEGFLSYAHRSMVLEARSIEQYLELISHPPSVTGTSGTFFTNISR